ncbi:hypothetical protein EW145_g6444 [Phellinidium pouzarii]|uniref:Uncharacterized protein n=1 Tax=Phellinidium pouzarii TaxID=167371 RepID=A0A4S4KWJ5_9AGAM|nr:hypothetical protein EW145_g6444 [Phellinidium pouzarii]
MCNRFASTRHEMVHLTLLDFYTRSNSNRTDFFPWKHASLYPLSASKTGPAGASLLYYSQKTKQFYHQTNVLQMVAETWMRESEEISSHFSRLVEQVVENGAHTYEEQQQQPEVLEAPSTPRPGTQSLPELPADSCHLPPVDIYSYPKEEFDPPYLEPGPNSLSNRWSAFSFTSSLSLKHYCNENDMQLLDNALQLHLTPTGSFGPVPSGPDTGNSHYSFTPSLCPPVQPLLPDAGPHRSYPCPYPVI